MTGGGPTPRHPPAPYAQNPAGQHVMVAPGAVKWGDGPPGLPPGARVAVVSGDPKGSGLYVLRVRMLADAKLPPHRHPDLRSVTVLQRPATSMSRARRPGMTGRNVWKKSEMSQITPTLTCAP